MNNTTLIYCEMWEKQSIIEILDFALENDDITESDYNKFLEIYNELEENEEETTDLEVSILDYLGVTDGIFEEYLENKHN